MRGKIPSRLLAAWLLVLGSFVAVPAMAHFLLNLNVRIFHVEHQADGLIMYARMPMPYLVADKVGEPNEAGLPAPAPYTTNRLEEEQLLVRAVVHEEVFAEQLV